MEFTKSELKFLDLLLHEMMDQLGNQYDKYEPEILLKDFWYYDDNIESIHDKVYQALHFERPSDQ